MEIWVLGTLEVSHQGRAIDVRGPLPRRLLALLALTPGREVSADRLVDGLWGHEPPPGAAATLQSHVARLRRDLGVPDVVRTGRRGYVLDVLPGDIDSVVLEQDVTRGSTALLEGRLDEASAILEDALLRWRGRPYAEFSGCEPLEVESERLAALRLDAIEQRISADLGRPGVTPPVAELEALVRWHPMRESYWALLMCAQYRSGRQADALASTSARGGRWLTSSASIPALSCKSWSGWCSRRTRRWTCRASRRSSPWGRPPVRTLSPWH